MELQEEWSPIRLPIRGEVPRQTLIGAGRGWERGLTPFS